MRNRAAYCGRLRLTGLHVPALEKEVTNMFRDKQAARNRAADPRPFQMDGQGMLYLAAARMEDLPPEAKYAEYAGFWGGFSPAPGPLGGVVAWGAFVRLPGHASARGFFQRKLKEAAAFAWQLGDNSPDCYGRHYADDTAAAIERLAGVVVEPASATPAGA